jgi:hypothetical protein
MRLARESQSAKARRHNAAACKRLLALLAEHHPERRQPSRRPAKENRRVLQAPRRQEGANHADEQVQRAASAVKYLPHPY